MSKLNSEQKSILKDCLIDFNKLPSANISQFPDMNLTIAVFRKFEGAKMLCVAISRASEDEPKFRKKVGQMEVLEKIDNGEFFQIPCRSEAEVNQIVSDFSYWYNNWN